MELAVVVVTLPANAANRFFSLDASAKFFHTIFSSEAGEAAGYLHSMFAFSLVRCVANLLTSMCSTLIWAHVPLP